MEMDEFFMVSGRDYMNVVYQLPARGFYDPYPGYYHREGGKSSSTPNTEFPPTDPLNKAFPPYLY